MPWATNSATPDKLGQSTHYTYDELNQQIKTTDALNQIRLTGYDLVGNTVFTFDAKGNTTAYIYDERNLLLTESRPLAAISQYRYNNMGDRTQAIDPEGRTTTWAYDLRRRPVSETNGANETTQTTYDGNGNRTAVIKPKGNTWTYSYDGANRLISLSDADQQATHYNYDNNGNTLSQTDANNNTTHYRYDALNRRVSKTYPDGAEESSAYDANNNRIAFTDAKGQQFSYTYDPLNRETERQYPQPAAPTGDDIQVIKTTYDANNNPVSISETYTGATGTQNTSRRYDNFDRLISVTDTLGKTLHYSYDANGNRTQLIDPDQQATRYRFDALNRLDTVTADNAITRYRYDRSSLNTQVDYPNGSQSTSDYDQAGRITTINHHLNRAVIAQYHYQYDANGNRRAQSELNGSQVETTTYDYDNNDRLTSVHYPEQHTTYTYDPAYNRLSETSVDTASHAVIVDKSYTYNNRNQHTSITDHLDASQNSVYQYDANGNQILKNQNGETTQFIYDVRDQLSQILQGSTDLGRYHYDYQGLRIKKTGDQGELHYTYDHQSVLTQSHASGTTVAKYDYGQNRLLSLKHRSEGRQYYHFDALGSPVALTKPDASVQARYHYDAWGHYRKQTGSSHNRFGFTGHEHDNSTGLIYAKARYYDPDTGRFLSQDAWVGDPSIAPSLHKYLYAYSNPTVWTDPTGHASVKTWTDENGQKHFSDGTDQAYKDYLARSGEQVGDTRHKSQETLAKEACAAQSNCFEKFAEAKHPELYQGQTEAVLTAENNSGPTADRFTYIDDKGKRFLENVGFGFDVLSGILNPAKGGYDTYEFAKNLSTDDLIALRDKAKKNPELVAAIWTGIVLTILTKGKAGEELTHVPNNTISASSPSEIAWGFGDLSKRQQGILDQLPDTLSSITLDKKSISVTDLAAMTARTGDEFALFTNGSQRLVVRGNANGVPMTRSELQALSDQGYKWSGHSHPGTSDLVLDASGIPGDRLVLDIFKQEQSLILNSAGKRNLFNMSDNIRIE